MALLCAQAMPLSCAGTSVKVTAAGAAAGGRVSAGLACRPGAGAQTDAIRSERKKMLRATLDSFPAGRLDLPTLNTAAPNAPGASPPEALASAPGLDSSAAPGRAS